MNSEADSSLSFDIVLMGGGGGIPIIAGGLLENLPAEQYEIAAILGVADSGSSSGVIRKLFGGPAVGDLRRALSTASGNGAGIYLETRFGKLTPLEAVELINRKFSVIAVAAGISQSRVDQVLSKLIEVAIILIQKEKTLDGHTYGNLFITALRLAHGGEIILAIDEANTWVASRAVVIPSTGTEHDIILKQDGQKDIFGEGLIDDISISDPASARITLEPIPDASLEAIHAIANANTIVVGPGSLLTSLIPTLGAKGLREAIIRQGEHGGKLVFLSNLIQEENKTEGLDGADYVDILEDYIGRPFDEVIYNTNTKALAKPVYFHKKPKVHNYHTRHMIGADLVDGYIERKDPNDKIAHLRSSRKHKVDVVAEYLKSIHSHAPSVS